MLTLYIIDSSAARRAALLEDLSRELSQAPCCNLIDTALRTISPAEAGFQHEPDVCLVGDLPEALCLPEFYPNAALFKLSEVEPTVEAAARELSRGYDAVLSLPISTQALVQRLLIERRQKQKDHQGSLILIQGVKGGQGATSIAAGLLEALQGQERTFIDFDFSLQLASRYLQAAPFINEALQDALAAGGLGADATEYETEVFPSGWCVSPPLLQLEGGVVEQEQQELLIQMIQRLRSCRSVVLVDAAKAPPSLAERLYQEASAVLLVLSNDPASLYAAYQKGLAVQAETARSTKIRFVLNGARNFWLKPAFIRAELEAALLSGIELSTIPFSRAGSMWPASGGTLFGCGGRRVRAAFWALAAELGLREQESRRQSLVQALLPAKEPALSLPLILADPVKAALPAAKSTVPEPLAAKETPFTPSVMEDG